MTADWNVHDLPKQLNLADVFLYRQLPRFGKKVAVRFQDTSLTYDQVAEATQRACAVYRSLGLEMEQRVLLMLPDVPEFIPAWFAAVQAGGVVAAVSPDSKPEEVAYYLNYTRAKLLVVHESALPVLEAVRDEAPFLKQVLVVGQDAGRFLSWNDALARAVPDATVAPTHKDDAAVWLFTSGSTGFPKAAVHKHHDFLFNALTYGLPILGLSENDVGLSVAKLAFGYALGTNLLFPFLAGGTVVLFPEKPTPERLFELLKRHRPTMLTAVPTSLNAMAQHPEVSSVDFSSLRLCISAGEALPEELYRKWKDKTSVEILDGIGSAEMFHIFITNRLGDVKLGSLGKVVEGYEARVCDDEGREVPRGEVGTLWVKGDSMALEYWQQHELSKHTFRGDFCVSADQFVQDALGYFYFSGRRDELLKVGGKWVSPLEVENCLLSHAAVAEAAVVGFLDDDGLQKPKAFVVLKDAASASAQLVEGLKTHVRERLSANKMPRQIEFLDALPKSDRGKVLKSQLSKRG